jgi:uncharacterized protein YprB with RNaseH-like and TPR domain
MKQFVFDIETGALPPDELAALLPPFDPGEVKLGNLKDAAKIAEKLREAEESHRRDFIEKAALDPLTGRVIAIGLLYPDSNEFVVIGDEDEQKMLREFWDVVRGEMGRVNQAIGFNTRQFDLPFLVRRSWKHRVPVPMAIRRGRYWSDEMIDLREAWQLGDRQARGSLDSIAKHLGAGSKNGSGADFAKLWSSDRAKAVEYLRNDLHLTAKVAQTLGFCN